MEVVIMEVVIMEVVIMEVVIMEVVIMEVVIMEVVIMEDMTMEEDMMMEVMTMEEVMMAGTLGEMILVETLAEILEEISMVAVEIFNLNLNSTIFFNIIIQILNIYYLLVK
jgi:hypothetical protein